MERGRNTKASISRDVHFVSNKQPWLKYGQDKDGINLRRYLNDGVKETIADFYNTLAPAQWFKRRRTVWFGSVTVKENSFLILLTFCL